MEIKPDRRWILFYGCNKKVNRLRDCLTTTVDDRDQPDDNVVVRVITKRKGALNVTAKGNYSENIFSGSQLAIDIGGDGNQPRTKEEGELPRLVP